MWEETEKLKRQIPLLDYLRRHNWSLHPVGSQQEFVGLCPLHAETRPSFYVNAARNLFFCHGCGRGGDLIRFAQLYFDLPFPQAVARLRQELAPSLVSESELLQQAVAFYQTQLHRHAEALQYLHQRGLHDPGLIQRLAMPPAATCAAISRHLAIPPDYCGTLVSSIAKAGTPSTDV